jgi:predicted site-specific integrase-resolvase
MLNMAHLQENLLSVTDAAKILGVSVSSVRSYCMAGTLEYITISGNMLLDREEVEVLKHRRERHPPKPGRKKLSK